MNKTESYLTQAIVGKRQRLVLGTQVRFQGEDLLPVRHSHGLFASFEEFVMVIADHFRGKTRLALFFALVFLAVMVCGGAYRHLVGQVDTAEGSPVLGVEVTRLDLPFARAPEHGTSGSAIAVESQPFPLDARAGAQEGGEPHANERLPVDPLGPNGPAPARVPPEKLVLQEPVKLVQPKSTPTAQQEVSEKEGKPNVDTPKGLVLDIGREAVEKKSSVKASGEPTVTPGASAGVVAAAKAPRLVEPLDVGAMRSTPVSQPTTSAPPTIVTIAEDNSYVLITNPSTRLPQKYQVGQKLPNGATIQRIDHAKGVVLIDGQVLGLK